MAAPCIHFLHVKPEQYNIAVLHYILLALGADKPFFPCGGQ